MAEKPLGNPMLNAGLTQEELSERGRKAGIASGEARRLRRTQADILRQILVLDYTDPERRKLLMQLGLTGSFADAINLSVLEKAAKGDVEAARYMRDTIGEKPREDMQVSVLDTPVEQLNMSELTDEELNAIVAHKVNQE